MAKVSHFHVFNAPAEGVPLEFCNDDEVLKTRMMAVPDSQKMFDDVSIHLDTITALDTLT